MREFDGWNMFGNKTECDVAFILLSSKANSSLFANRFTPANKDNKDNSWWQVFVFDGSWMLYHVLPCCQTYFAPPRKKETLVYLPSSHFENNLTSPFFQKKKNLINKKYSFFVALPSLCLFSPCVGCVVLAGKSLLIFETERSNFCNKLFNKKIVMEVGRTSFYSFMKSSILWVCYALFLIRISCLFIMLFSISGCKFEIYQKLKVFC